MTSGARFRYSYDVEEDWLGSRKKHLPIEEASMKKLIDDEMSKRSISRQNGPSIVARLMGMDVLPVETKSTLYPTKKREELARTNSSNYERNLRSPPIVHRYSNSYSFEHEFDPDYDSTSSRPKQREHPQEEELQKFKKEFLAWQAAARFKECSRYAETENPSVEPKSHLVEVKSPARSCSRRYGEKKSEIYAAERKEIGPLPVRTRYRENHEQPPTTIVVLKPGPDRIWSSEDSWTSFSGSSEEKGSIEDFLEEVKDRLKHELQGKVLQKGPVEKPQDPQKIAKEISNRVRESVTRHLELGPGLVRSESTRSHKSDIQLNDMSSPEFISRDSRRFLTERLKNVLKRESDINIPIGVGRNFSRSCLSNEKSLSQKHEEFVRTEEDRFFRDESLSPKNLVRSLSAPVSGTSFGKLLLEDPHVVTGAHIRRKHELSIENLFAGTKKGRREKERFSLREKVYNFRSSFTLRGRLFRKRMASMTDLRTCEPSFMKDIMNGPTVILNPGERYENSTEVPPSPASVCSSTAQEEFWRPSNDLSPISSPETTSGENYNETRAFGEITSTCNELQRQLSRSSSEKAAEGAREHELGEPKLPELEGGPAAYVRTLLVASGMYDGLSSPFTWRSEPLAKPITTSIFEEVEGSYKKQDKDKDGDEKGIGVDHRVLYDLLNEALLYVLGPPVISSRFGKKLSVPCDRQHPHGARLMDSVWGFICPLVYPQEDVSTDYSLDFMVATDLGSVPWLVQSLDKQVDAIGTDIESSILGDLIGEVVRDIKLRC